jgi:hypothetical protein
MFVPMMAWMLLAIVADLVFESAAALRRSYAADLERYLDRRGFRHSRARQRPVAR